jgi:hypothetical protein
MSELTPEQRSAIFNGETPRIRGEGDCPLHPAKPVYLSSRLWILPVAVHTRLKGRGFVPGENVERRHWELEYTIHDHRDRYLGAAPVMSEAERQSRRWSYDAEHGYTSNPYAPLADAGTAVDPAVQEQQTKDANRKWAMDIAETRKSEIAAQQTRTINNKIKRLVKMGSEVGVDVTPKLAVALRDIENDIAAARGDSV